MTEQRTLFRRLRRALYLLPLGFYLLFLIYPLLRILGLSFAEGFAGVRATLSDSYTWRVLGFSTWQALLSTALTLAFGLPGAYVFARYEFPGKALLRALAGVPFVLPTVVTAAAFGALLGPRGLINLGLQSLFDLAQPPIRLQGSLGLVLIAHAFYNYTIVLRLVGGMLANLDPRLEEAAATLGARRVEIWWRVTLPLLAPALGAAALLVFLFTFTSFGVILLLGGPRMATIEVEIYRQTAQFLRLDIAATLAFIQAICCLLLSVMYARLSARSAVPLDLQPQQATARKARSWRSRVLLIANSGLILLLLGGPLLALVVRSLLAGSDAAFPLTFTAYSALAENRTNSAFFVTPAEAIFNSLRIAFAATGIALLIGLPAAYLLAQPNKHAEFGRSHAVGSSLLDAFFMLPLGVSAVTLGFGYTLALSTPGLVWLRSSPLLLPILHALVALPFVIRSLLPALRARSPRQSEAAATLGAGPWRTWLWVELPQLTPAILTGALFAFTVSLGEFGATLLLARPEAPTLPVVIFRLLGMPGALNYAQALAASSLLMLVCAAGFLAIERIRPPGSEF
ncbi:MAG: iron ABC transporter permease [Oscillochloris sp.]|nr:iron ABC transporter permease [Oscillochloris sp.]